MASSHFCGSTLGLETVGKPMLLDPRRQVHVWPGAQALLAAVPVLASLRVNSNCMPGHKLHVDQVGRVQPKARDHFLPAQHGKSHSYKLQLRYAHATSSRRCFHCAAVVGSTGASLNDSLENARFESIGQTPALLQSHGICSYLTILKLEQIQPRGSKNTHIPPACIKSVEESSAASRTSCSRRRPAPADSHLLYCYSLYRMQIIVQLVLAKV